MEYNRILSDTEYMQPTTIYAETNDVEGVA